MRTADSLPPLRELVRNARGQGETIAYVPTMGALHEGHLSLVRQARGEKGFTVVSIFVNPLQFGPGEDFARYPRRPQEDAALLDQGGADLLYLPDAASFYPPGFSTFLDVGEVSEGGEGSVRPGHFRGVATVVAKLLLQVLPDVAFFGRKDLQQLAVIRRMVRDLDFPVRVEAGETVREADGLALSSRNAYLSPQERRQAALFPRALLAARDRAASSNALDARRLSEQTRRELEGAGFSVDYADVVDPDTMRRLEEIRPGATLAAAVRLGKTRLIDNVLLREQR